MSHEKLSNRMGNSPGLHINVECRKYMRVSELLIFNIVEFDYFNV